MEVDVVSLSAEFPNDNPALHRGAIWVVTHPTAAPTAELPEPLALAEVEVEAPLVAPVPVPETEQQEQEEAPAPVLVLLEPAPAPVAVAVEPEEEPPSLFEELVAEMAPARPSGIIAIPPEARLDTFEIEDDEDEDDVLIEEIEPLIEAVVEGAVEGALESSPPAPLESEVVLAEAANDVVSATSLPPPPDDPFTVLLYTLADVAVAAGSPHVASVLPALLLEGRLADLTEEARAALAEASILEGEGVSAGFARTLEAWKAILRGTSDDFDATGGVMLDEWAASLLARLLGAPGKSETLRRDLRSRGVAAFGLAA